LKLNLHDDESFIYLKTIGLRVMGFSRVKLLLVVMT
jgi:hypothetical protein